MTTVLLAGAGGYVGAHLIRRLLSTGGVKVVGVDRSIQAAGVVEDGNLTLESCDLSNRDATFALFEKNPVDVVVNAAAAIGTRNDEGYLWEVLNSNVLAHANLVAASLRFNCKRFVFCSSIGVYPPSCPNPEGFTEEDRPGPINLYGWSKLSGEELLKVVVQGPGPLKGVTLRMAGIHGRPRNSGVVYQMIKASLEGRPIDVSEPESRFQSLFVQDAAKALELAIFGNVPEGHTCFNVAGDEVFSLEELARNILRLTGSRSEVLSGESRRIRNQTMDIRKIKTELGYRPADLEGHLKDLIDHWGNV